MSPPPSDAAVVTAAPLATRRRRRAHAGMGWTIAGGTASVVWLSLIVLIPLVAVSTKAFADGPQGVLDQITNRQAVNAIVLTVAISAVVALVNAVIGTMIAWVLVRDEFPGKAAVNALIDLPFALPTIVAGLVLLALYGPSSPVGINVAYTRVAILLALLFVTLPFVVRSVQPVLIALDREVEQAAASLGAGPITTFRRVILPALTPAILAGVGLAFGRSLGEFGSIVLISGNLPYETEVASVFIFSQIESGNLEGAASVSLLLLVVSLAVLVGIGLLASKVADRG